MTALKQDETLERGATLQDYVAVVRRRWRIVLAAVVICIAAVTALSLTQSKRYEATAEVLLSRQNLAAMLTNTQDPNLGVQADRFAETQAKVAAVPTVATRVLAATGTRDMTPE